MKAAVFYGGFDIRVEEVAEPEVHPGQVLVRVVAAGICGSDLHECLRTAVEGVERPYRTGHELSGEIAVVGPDVAGFHVGQSVAVEPMHLLGCGACMLCRRGFYHICPTRGRSGDSLRHSSGFSEYDVVDATNLHVLPAGLSLEDAALVDVYGVAVHTFHLLPPRPASPVVIIGTGAVALTQGQVARSLGAYPVIVVGRRRAPLDIALAAGAADEVVEASTRDPVEAVMALTDGRGADIVIEAAGGWSEAVEQACAMTAFGGRVGTVGGSTKPITLDPSIGLRKEIELRWINSYSTWEGVSEFGVALALMGRGMVRPGPVITHRIPLVEIREAFALARDKGRSSAIKVLLIP